MTFLCHTRYATGSESPHTSTVWKFKNFTDTQISREINFVSQKLVTPSVRSFTNAVTRTFIKFTEEEKFSPLLRKKNCDFFGFFKMSYIAFQPDFAIKTE